MKKQLISEREINQRMIKQLKENINGQQPEVTASESDVANDQAEFRQNVAMDAKFTEFSILPDAGNVIFKGSIPGICEWKFELTNRDGVEITIPQPTKIDKDILDIFTKMDGVFANWKGTWSTKLIEYQKTSG
jgi:predicted metal-dependent RNase